MKKIFKQIIPAAALMLSLTACNDFLDTSSPSVVDRESVFSNEESARSALYYGYQKWHDARSIHSVGWFWGPVWGSDIEDFQDTWSDGSADCQEKAFYPGGTENFNINTGEGVEVFEQCYEMISICNSLISSYEALPNFSDIMSGEPNSLSDIYGQAVALRATCYFELTKWYGDVPLVTKAGEKAEGIASRFAIYDYNIAKLREVETHMFRPGEGTSRADVMNRTYVQGLIARLCLFNGGYATRRTDIAGLHVDAEGNPYQFDDWSVEKNKCIYGRRADWRNWYEIAETYLTAAVNQPGSVKFHMTDPRPADGNRVYDNPFQYFFQQLHSGASEGLADESVYEIVMEFNNGGDRPGYIGRPSTGGNNGAPCIGCGQDRVQAHFYYGWYDNNDKRRDASCCVTGSNGKGQELMQSFNRSAWGQGCGPGTNKWDWNRLATPNTSNYGTPGINCPYMRMAEIYLMLAEVQAALGKEGSAKNYLGIVHHRNFPNGTDPNFEKYIAECGGVWEAVMKERALEFVGEGFRRFDLIRTGLLPKACVEDRQIMTAVVDGVHANGHYTFANGNELPAYVWTKLVDAKADKKYGYRLTAQCQDENDPVLFPGWRGQHDDWGSVPTAAAYGSENMTNLAIKGLFKTIEPDSEEAKALEAEGYEKTPWAVDMYQYKNDYATKLLCGYTDADYAAKNPPVYMIPMIYKVLQNSGLTNGYGFRQE